MLSSRNQRSLPELQSTAHGKKKRYGLVKCQYGTHTETHTHIYIDIFFAETTSVVILRCKNTLALHHVVEANRPWSVSMRHPKFQKIYVLNLRRDIALKAVAILIQQAPLILINTAPDGQNNQKNMFLWVGYEVFIVSHNLSFAIPLSWMYYIKYHVIWDRIITRRDSMGMADSPLIRYVDHAAQSSASRNGATALSQYWFTRDSTSGSYKSTRFCCKCVFVQAAA